LISKRREVAGIRVFRIENGPEAKREAGASPGHQDLGIKTGAAPATVSGERLSLRATGVMHREGQTDATTRKPGDLP